ncbi:MAG: glycosyltransferase family 4 protein [Planctomycetes bacterium]|nr:glycosyltransferase family 4 protein [Planctomycetota bacterium]
MPVTVTFLLAHFPPDVAADGQLFSLLARDLAVGGHNVNVITFRPGYQGSEETAPSREIRDGVRIRRMWAPRVSKSGLIRRAFLAWWMTFRIIGKAMFTGGVFVIPSSPPTLGLVGWALNLIGRRYIYVLHDVHPELGIALGKIQRQSIAAKVLRFINRRIMRRAQVTITLTNGMKERAIEICSYASIAVIPNWIDTEAIKPKPKADSKFAQANNLLNKFTLQYSGNMGVLHPLEALTQAMKALEGKAELAYIGRGARLQPVKALVESSGISNVHFFDYQPLDQLEDSLAACDLAVVALATAADGLAMPSKLQGILASGRPILALAAAESEVAKFVESQEIGIVVSDFDNPEAIEQAIESALKHPQKLLEMGQRARKLAEEKYSVAQAMAAYFAFLKRQ